MLYIYIYIILIKKTIFLKLIYQPSNNFESVNRVIDRIKVFKNIQNFSIQKLPNCSPHQS